MPLIGDEVKRQAEGLIAETEVAAGAAESEGPKYVGWLGRVQLLVDRLGPEGATFANELRRLRNPDTWAGRLKLDDESFQRDRRKMWEPLLEEAGLKD